MSKPPRVISVHVTSIPQDQFARMKSLGLRMGVGKKNSDIVRFFCLQGYERCEREQVSLQVAGAGE